MDYDNLRATKLLRKVLEELLEIPLVVLSILMFSLCKKGNCK